MIIECLIQRQGPTYVTIGGQYRYTFEKSPAHGDRAVAMISRDDHQKYFLKEHGQHYREYVPNKVKLGPVPSYEDLNPDTSEKRKGVARNDKHAGGSQ